MRNLLEGLRASAAVLAAALAAAGCTDSPTLPHQLTTVTAGSTLMPHEWMYADAAPGAALVTRVILRDNAGNPVPGTRVRWTVKEGGGSFAGTYSTTDASGIAEQSWTMGPPGPQRATATIRDLPAARFEANSVIGEIFLDTIVSGLQQPIHLTAPANDSRLFVVEEIGTIRVIENGITLATPFLDLRSAVSTTGERGLLSMAFHPDYASNGFFFVNYTDLAGNTRIERYHATPGANVADAASAKLIIAITQPYANHNGGHLLFGPGGLLFIPMGDGGSGGDPHGNGQNPATLLGKLLRINVDVRRAYAVPRSNPYVGDASKRPEIWARGLRNPWRIAIDDGLLYVADVGQGQREEINVVNVNEPDVNYGWNTMEGSMCRTAGCSTTGLHLPAVDYTHAEGCAVTGGPVYRGSELPEIAGTYFYADFCGGWIRSFRFIGGEARQTRQWNQLGTVSQPASFGVDGLGEMYVLSRLGHVLRFTRRNP